MLSTTNTIFFAFFFLLYMIQTPAFAVPQSYIVYMGEHDHGPDLTEANLQAVSDAHIDFLALYLGSKEKAKEALILSYRRIINGFAALLDEKVANEIKKNDKVISVFLDKRRMIHTTRAWEFLSLEKDNLVLSSSLWKKANFGEGVIIGNLDSGVWPESQSFNDEGYGPIPPRWKGKCSNEGDPTFVCNRKLIGARYYKDSYEAQVGKLNSSMYSPRDFEGHGTHTLSTAGGNFVHGVKVVEGPGNNINGTAKGGAPKVRVATYKICWPVDEATSKGGCYDADILKAFDHAIYDGVDVITGSIGGLPSDYLHDASSIGSMNAIKHDRVVVMSGGNEGPGPQTITNLSPWLLTVGASTMDRDFQNDVELGNGLRLKGFGITKALPEEKPYPLVSGVMAKSSNASTEAAALYCREEALDAEKVKGKILVCVTGEVPQLEISQFAAKAGAVGVIYCASDLYNVIQAAYNVLPTTRLRNKDGLVLLDYVKSTANPVGFFKAPVEVLNIKPSPVMAFFSSKGPNSITPEILKPDVTAPGVNVLAAYTGATSPSDLPPNVDNRKFSYAMISGTSMSCPMVAGIAALLKAIYPQWSPAAIKSAIMTTATPLDNTGGKILNSSLVQATPFDYGAGHIQPDRAVDPGLIYDLHMEDYLNFMCVIGYNDSMIKNFYRKPYQCPPFRNEMSLINLNYPSITVPKLKGTVEVTRRVRNVGPAGTYIANITEPKGISVVVEPKVLEFKKPTDVKSFKLTLTAKEQGASYVFGSLLWSDGRHSVRSPITVSTI